MDAGRLEAYTGVRSDIVSLIPAGAVRILDLGCSDGALGAALKALVHGRVVHGVEYSSALVKVAETRLDRALQADLNRDDALQPLAGQQYDCIVCADVLEHLVNPEILLQRITGLLAPNGSVVVSLPNIRHVSALTAIYLKGTFPRRPRGIFDDTHLRWFTIADGKQLLREAGFRVDDVHYTLRCGDQGGGRVNRALNRFIAPHAGRCGVFGELLCYQFAMRASLSAQKTMPENA